MKRGAKRPPAPRPEAGGAPPNSNGSSMVTDPRSPVSISYDPSSARLPSSPRSFTSNNAGSTVDGGSATQQATSQRKGGKGGNSSNSRKKAKAEKKPPQGKGKEKQTPPPPQSPPSQSPPPPSPPPPQNPIQLAPIPIHAMETGLCARRLRQYLFYHQNRPAESTMTYWKQFVAEFYAPGAKKRWCLSNYEMSDIRERNVLGRASGKAWDCGVCGAKSGKGYEAGYESLPRLYQIKFDGADELLFLDKAREWRSSGLIVLDYAKAVIESIHEQQRVVHEGQLRIVFTPNLKILSWEFCIRHHEEFLSRKLVAQKANPLFGVLQKFENAVVASGSSGFSPQDLQAANKMFGLASMQLAKNLETSGSLGFSRKFAWALQSVDVVNSMKDLIDLSKEQKIGPIECLNRFQRPAVPWFQAEKMREVEHMATAQGLPAYYDSNSKMLGMLPGLSTLGSNNDICSLNNPSSSSMAALNPSHNSATFTIHPDASWALGTSSHSRYVPHPLSSFAVPTEPKITSHPSWKTKLECNLPEKSFSLLSSKVDQHLMEHSSQDLAGDKMNSSNDEGPKLPTGVPDTSDPDTSESVNLKAGSGHGAGDAGELPATTSSHLAREESDLGNNIDNMPDTDMGIAQCNSGDLQSTSCDPSAEPDLDPYWQDIVLGDLGYRL